MTSFIFNSNIDPNYLAGDHQTIVSTTDTFVDSQSYVHEVDAKVINVISMKGDSNVGIGNVADDNITTYWNASGVSWTSSTYEIKLTFDKVYTITKFYVKFVSGYSPFVLQLRRPDGTNIQQFDVSNNSNFQEFILNSPYTSNEVRVWYDMSTAEYATPGQLYEISFKCNVNYKDNLTIDKDTIDFKREYNNSSTTGKIKMKYPIQSTEILGNEDDIILSNRILYFDSDVEVSGNFILRGDISANISAGSSLPSATEYAEYLYYDDSTSSFVSGGGSTKNYNIALGSSSTKLNTLTTSNRIGIGRAANYDSSSNTIALGIFAGQKQGNGAIAIGSGCATLNQKEGSVAIGKDCAYTNQGANSIALGTASGQNYAKEKSISLGYFAGRNYNGIGSLCLGNNTESTNYDGTVVISGGTTGLSANGSNRCFISPIRNASNSNVLMYDASTKEITYDIPPTPQIGSAILRETTSAGTNSNVSFTNNIRTLRQMNVIQFNSLGITLSGSPNWTITIPTAGTYLFRARGIYGATRTGSNPFAISSKLFIKNESSGGGLDDWIVGENSRWLTFDSTSGAYPFNFQAECSGIQTITGSTTISLRQVCNDALSSGTKNGGIAVSLPSGSSVPEIYATLEIQKIA